MAQFAPHLIRSRRRRLMAAQRIGATDIQMDWIQLGPWTSPDEKGFGVAPKIVEAVVGYGFMVDPETGKRFVNETGNRKVRSDAIVATGHPAVLAVSVDNVGHVPAEALKTGLEKGVVKTLIRQKPWPTSTRSRMTPSWRLSRRGTKP